MKFENITIELNDRIAHVTLNRPTKLNALSVQLFEELKDLILSLKVNPELVRGLILTGAGGKAFAAGADIKQMSRMTQDEAHDFSALAQEVTLLLEELPIPTIAAVDGFALGGGCELAMACDFIYATEQSKFGQPEVSLGLIPGFGGCIRLIRHLGLPRAKEYIYSGRQIHAQKAVELGLVNEIYSNREELLSAAVETMKEIFKNSGAGIGYSKQVINSTQGLTTAEGLEKEREAFTKVFIHPEKVEGVSAFLEKRMAQF